LLHAVDERAEAIRVLNEKYIYDNRVKQLSLEIRQLIDDYHNGEEGAED